MTAEPGSDHGYDVVDHATVDEARGGRGGLERLAAAARARGVGVLVDIVPNHLGVATPRLSTWWWDVLRHGQASVHAAAFDIDWAAGGGRLRVPVLGDEAAPVLRVEDGELRYFDHRFPIAPATATAGATPAEVHAAQHYELVGWRRADHELNYRRFFAVNTLAGVRVECPTCSTPATVRSSRGSVTGPVGGSSTGCASTIRTAWLIRVATSIGSPCHRRRAGLGREDPGRRRGVAGALADRRHHRLRRARRLRSGVRRSGRRGGVRRARRRGPWWSGTGVGRPGPRRQARRRRRDASAARCAASSATLRDDGLGAAIPDAVAIDTVAELLACFPVYRSYLPLGGEHLRDASAAAIAGRPDLAAAVAEITTLLAEPTNWAAVRFQQTSGMVMAKGVEDAAYYRFTRLGSLTEVGADPAEWSIDAAELHRRKRAARPPGRRR